MIIDVISSFDAQYENVKNKINFERTTNSNIIISNKASICEFLNLALVDCFTIHSVSYYSSLIVNDYEKLSWFKEKHTKKDFIKFIGNMNKN